MFSTLFEDFLPFSSNLKLSSANSQSLEESKICYWVIVIDNGLMTLRKKAFENNVEKGENASSQHFLSFSLIVLYPSAPHSSLSGERVGLMTWCLWVRSLVEVTFISGVFSPLTFQKPVRKVVGGFGKKSCVSTSVRKPANIYAPPTTMIWP